MYGWLLPRNSRELHLEAARQAEMGRRRFRNGCKSDSCDNCIPAHHSLFVHARTERSRKTSQELRGHLFGVLFAELMLDAASLFLWKTESSIISEIVDAWPFCDLTSVHYARELHFQSVSTIICALIPVHSIKAKSIKDTSQMVEMTCSKPSRR